MDRWVAAAAGLVMVGPALGQSNTFEFVISNIVSPEQPSAVVQLWAVFDQQWWALASAHLDVRAAEPAFSDPSVLVPGSERYDGDLSPEKDAVLSIALTQYCHLPEIPPDASNPLLMWQATWSTDYFHPRTVDLTTLTEDFSVFVYEGCSIKQLVLNGFTEGAGQVVVVPSPWGLGVFGLVAPRLFRRKRQQ
jgi:hypothetical protein